MFIDMLFALTCQDFKGVDQEACRKAIEAGTKQTGIYQGVSEFENYATKTVEKTARDTVGDEILVYPAVAAKVYRERAVVYGFNPKTLGMDRIETRVTFDGAGSVNFKWSF